MSVAAIARRDLTMTCRSRLFRGLTVVLTVFSVFGVSLYALSGVTTASTARAVGLLTLPSVLLVPLAAIVVGYVAVLDERRSGTLKLLLGFPVTRAAVLCGKLVGRVAVVVGAIGIAFAVAGGAGLALYDGFPVLRYAGFALATAALGVAFTGLAVGLSATVRSRGRALAIAVGVYLLFVLFWQPIVAGTYSLVTGALPGVRVPAWYLLLDRLSPTSAYQVLAEAALNVPARASVLSLRPPKAATASVAEQLGGGPVPPTLSAPAAVFVLALWTALPTAVGYWRFSGGDL